MDVVDHSKVLDVEGRIILKCISKIEINRHGLDLSGSEYGHAASFCECGNENVGFIRFGEFID
jgi:hypothetical protein